MNNKDENIAFQVIDWSLVPETSYCSASKGIALWKTVHYPHLRMRVVQYSPGYLADHWCAKGHIVHCLEGNFVSELRGGLEFRIVSGMSYVVSDNMSHHRSRTEHGVKLLIIDGDFLEDR